MRNLDLKNIYQSINTRNLVLSFPILILIVKHWASAVTILAFILSVAFIVKNVNSVKTLFESPNSTKLKLVCLMLASPFLAVSLGQIFRLEFSPREFDAPLRIALCIPVFLAVASGWLREGESNSAITELWMTRSIPAALIVTLVFCTVAPFYWGSDRLATYFVDPLTLGAVCLLFSILTLAPYIIFKFKSSVHAVIVFAVFIVGIYLSIMSGSRTGWASLPLLSICAVFYYFKPKYGVFKSLVGLICFFVGGAYAIALLAPTFTAHITLGAHEFVDYNWNSINPVASVSDRISMYRMGIIYFLKQPLSGWGQLGWMKVMDMPEIMVFASEQTRIWPKAGFHNEIITSAVRSGIWGLCSSVMQFVVPFYFAVAYARKTVDSVRLIAIFVFAYTFHSLIFGLTTEITGLVFLASFFGLTQALCLGELIYTDSRTCR